MAQNPLHRLLLSLGKLHYLHSIALSLKAIQMGPGMYNGSVFVIFLCVGSLVMELCF